MPVVGELLAGRYRIDGRLGAGGMASVWRARDLRLGRDVAVKVLLANLAADPTLAQRFDREARSLAAAAHPGVVAVFDVDPGDPDTGREPFYVMELAEGGSLADRLAPSGRLPPGEVAAIIAQVAHGLAELHRRGMVHRDIKPHNIVFAGGRPKLADFGLARSEAASDITALTQTGTTVGTLAYLAPELVGGQPASAASDVYALGVVAFVGLTGRLPRPSGSMAEVVEGRLAAPARASDMAPDLGPHFDSPLAAALSADPAARPDPTALADALSSAVTLPAIPMANGLAQQTTVSVPTTDRRPAARAGRTTEHRPVRGRPAVLAFAAFGLAVLVLLAAAALLGRPPGGQPSASAAAGAASPSAPATAPASEAPPSAPPSEAPPADEVSLALAEVARRIDEAEAAGLGSEDAERLRRAADEVRQFIERGNEGQARRRAERLVQEVDDVEDDLPDDVADPLLRAVENLRDSIPGDS